MAGLLSPNEMFQQMFLGNRPNETSLLQMGEQRNQAGRDIGKALGLLGANKIFGAELTNPEIQQRQQLLNSLAGLDFTNPQDQRNAVQVATAMGNPELALKFLETFSSTNSAQNRGRSGTPPTWGRSVMLDQNGEPREVRYNSKDPTQSLVIVDGQAIPRDVYEKQVGPLTPVVTNAPAPSGERNTGKAISKLVKTWGISDSTAKVIGSAFAKDIAAMARQRAVRRSIGEAGLLELLKESVDDVYGTFLGPINFDKPSKEELRQIRTKWREKVNAALKGGQSGQAAPAGESVPTKAAPKPQAGKKPRKVFEVNGVKVEQLD